MGDVRWQSAEVVLTRMTKEASERCLSERDQRLMRVRGDYDPEPEELDGVRRYRRRYPARDAELRRLHHAGATGAELSDQFALSHQRISQILRGA